MLPYSTLRPGEQTWRDAPGAGRLDVLTMSARKRSCASHRSTGGVCAATLMLITALGVGCKSSEGDEKKHEPRPASKAPTPPPLLTGVTKLVSGLKHSCALSNGVVRCWGQRLGWGASDSPHAEVIPGLPADIVDISSAGRRVCALSKAGALYCWGERLGQPLVGRRNQVYLGTPKHMGIVWGGLVKLDYGTRITKVAVGLTHICALTDKHDLYCWGSDNGHQFGYGRTRTPIDAPHLVAEGVQDVTVGHGWTCFRRADKQQCWGHHWRQNDLTQQQNAQFPGWVLASCGITGDKKVQCEGRLRFVYAGRKIPKQAGGTRETVPGLDDVRQLTLGYNHGCVLRGDGAVWCWSDKPQHQPLPGKAIHISAGMDHTCALLESGQVACWGKSDKGQAGDRKLRDDHEVALIRAWAQPFRQLQPSVLRIDAAVTRYRRLATPRPADLTGSVWRVRLRQSIRDRNMCTYTLRFDARRRFIAEGNCGRLGTTKWLGTWKPTKGGAYVRERPAPAGTTWEWKLRLRGALMTGLRQTLDGEVAYNVEGGPG